MNPEIIGSCAVEGCDKPVFRGRGCAHGMCAAHARRKERGLDMVKPIRPYRVEPWRRVVEASLALAEAEGDEEWERAECRLRAAIKSYSAARHDFDRRLLEMAMAGKPTLQVVSE